MGRRNQNGLKQLQKSLTRRKFAAETMAAFLPNPSRQRFIYERTFRNEIEAVSYPLIKRHGFLPNFTNPDTYVEKMRSLWLIHPNPLMSLVADKVKVRDYFGLFDLPIKPMEILDVVTDPKTVTPRKLPKNCILKLNDGSGGNLLHSPENPVDNARLQRFLGKWWELEFWRILSELHYRDIPRKLLIEETLLPTENILEFSFFCTSGSPYLGLCEGDGVRLYTDLKGQPSPPPTDSDPPNTPVFKKPHRWEEMVYCAEKLSAGFLHSRIDFMLNGDRVVLGEITLSPGGLWSMYSPFAKEIERGTRIDMSKLPDLLDHGRQVAAKLNWPVETSFGHFAGDPRLSTAGQS